MQLARGVSSGLVGLAMIAACGGKIAPVDDFNDPPLVASSGSSGTSGKPAPTGTGKPLPPAPTGIPLPGPPPKPKPDPPPPIDKNDPPPDDSFKWQPLEFLTQSAYSKCMGGKKYVRPSKRYGVWVGVELCSATMYKLYLSYSRKGLFHEIADYAGNGQDHCELVNPTFTLPNEDDINSGTCETCDIDSSSYDHPGWGTDVFDRGYFGDDFNYDPWPAGYYTAAWYACGVAIP